MNESTAHEPTVTTSSSSAEQHVFQAEVRQLLDLMIHSLYSNREIFLRELVSNASDACDKRRFESLAKPDRIATPDQLAIEIDVDRESGELIVRDNGIGMSADEVRENIGTIARSGTRSFLAQLSGDQQKDAQLIGQFGVGFYSAFTVADAVTLVTRRADAPADAAVKWHSTADGTYTIEPVEREAIGTEVRLYLKEDAREFLEDYRLRHLIRKYSDHIGFPVRMRRAKDSTDAEDAAGDGSASQAEWETVNQAAALWTRSKSDVSDAEYKAFYHHVAADYADPLAWTHNRVEGRQEYTSLLYIPSRAPFDLWDRDAKHGVKLYVKRVFIMDDAQAMLPNYLRFVRGVIDSADLPLNVSREILQDNRLVDGIRAGSTKKILALLEDLAKDKPEQYQIFWNTFGRVLKEGPGEDFVNRDTIAGLLRFASTRSTDDVQNVSLADYKARMHEGQKAIYVVSADSAQAARKSPHLEVFRARGIEVLLLSDRVDEWLLSHLHEFDGTPIENIAKGELDVNDLPVAGGSSESRTTAGNEKADEAVLERVREQLAGRVEAVRASSRLVDSPACLVLGKHEMALYLQELLKQAGQTTFGSKPTLELNLAHPLVKRLAASEGESFADLAELLFEQSVIAEGGQIEDPHAFVERLNRLLLERLTNPSEQALAPTESAGSGETNGDHVGSDTLTGEAGDGASANEDAASNTR